MISRRRASSISVSLVLLSLASAASTAAEVPSGSRSGESAAAPNPRADRPGWGTKDRVLYAVGFGEFSPLNSSDTYQSPLLGFGRYSTVAFGRFLATPHIPSGVLLTYLELDYFDISASDNVTLSLRECNFVGNDCDEDVLAALTSGTGPQGFGFLDADLTPLNYTTNNNTKRLYLIASTNSGDVTNMILGAYIGYKLQVSPAPGTATFGDVPTSHPYFRFIEALYDAGITAGCGAGNYCPGAAITRGEMAVFLAKALGLHFPN